MHSSFLKTKAYELARSILGLDLITPEKIMEAQNLSYTKQQLLYFRESVPSEYVLQWCRNNGFLLVAGPPNPMSLIDIRHHYKKYFYIKSGGWYAEDNQRFSREDKVTAAWLMLRKDSVPNSINKKWSQQQELLSEVEYVPNAPEMAWGITTYKEVSDVWLFPDIYVKTSSVRSDGHHVGVGDSSDGGISICGRWDGYRSDNLGIASAWKRN